MIFYKDFFFIKMFQYINIFCIILSVIIFSFCKQPEERIMIPYEEKQLHIQSIKLIRAKEFRYFQFYYQAKQVKKIEISTNKSTYKRHIKYHYKKNGQLSRITHHPIGNPIKFEYDNNRLIEISHYNNSQTRNFVYDKKGRIIEEKILFNNKLFLIIKYTYTNKNISEVIHEDPLGNILRQYQITFSPLVNIFKNLGPDLNLSENILGYMIGNHDFLIQEIKEIKKTKTGESKIKDFIFTYNRYNYPLTIDNEWEITYHPIFLK